MGKQTADKVPAAKPVPAPAARAVSADPVAARRAVSSAVAGSAPALEPPAGRAEKSLPRSPQELRALARALEELCLTDDAELDKFRTRRAVCKTITREDLRRMRDVGRWLCELLPSAYEQAQKRIELVWSTIRPLA